MRSVKWAIEHRGESELRDMEELKEEMTFKLSF